MKLVLALLGSLVAFVALCAGPSFAEDLVVAVRLFQTPGLQDFRMFATDDVTVAQAVTGADELRSRLDALPECPRFLERCVGRDGGAVVCPSQLDGGMPDERIRVLRRCREGPTAHAKFAPCDDDAWRLASGLVAE